MEWFGLTLTWSLMLILLAARFENILFELKYCLQQMRQFIHIRYRWLGFYILRLQFTKTYSHRKVKTVQYCGLVVRLLEIRTNCTYMWSAFVCSRAAVNWRVNASSFIDSKWFASSATRGWKSNDFFDGDPTDDSDIGSSLSTEIDIQSYANVIQFESQINLNVKQNTYSRRHLLDQLA